METEVLREFKGFSQLDYNSRLERLRELNYLTDEDINYLKSGGIKDHRLAENLIENVLGYFNLPLGVAVNFVINSKPYVIPLAVEETSIIAAASKTARWVSEHGTLKAKVLGRLSIGQIQIARVKDFSRLEKVIEENFKSWQDDVHKKVIPSMLKRGGGLKGYELRKIKYSGGRTMAVWHLHLETCDAMGANSINQVCEYLKTPLEQASGEQVTMCILSNLADKRLFRAEAVIKNQDLGLIERIEAASLFAENDPYRAATNNKGALNSIDSLLIATGNDWRAAEAGLHAYASRSGSYSSLTRWRVREGHLYGELEGPLMLGTVGGVTDIHPTAALCLKMLGRPSAEELGEICMAVGLVQNLGAVRALVTEGVVEGHMKLHIKNMALKAGATFAERSFIEKHLLNIVDCRKRISLTQVYEALSIWRKKKHFPPSS